MSTETGFILYALSFRLAIIAVGFMLVYFGYQLFSKQDQLLKTSIEASILAAKIRITNTTSGTAFAVIGCILLAITISKGEPELIRNGVEHSSTGDSRSLILRGQGTPFSADTLEGFVGKGVEADKAGNSGTAADNYRQALALISAPLNNLAYIYCVKNEMPSAKGLIDLAIQISPENVTFRRTAEEIKSATCSEAKR